MAPIEKRLLVPSRRRALPVSGFSWIDRRLIRDGFLAGLTGPESLLYYFLVTVADQDGLSYYGDRRIAALLKLAEPLVEQARRGLERKDLIVYRAPLYQVLSLPTAPATTALADITLHSVPNTSSRPSAPTLPSTLGSVLRRMIGPPPDASGGHPR